jgi:hypothetical protein
MTRYKCNRTFTSPFTHVRYEYGDIISEYTYQHLKKEERLNFDVDTSHVMIESKFEYDYSRLIN